MPRPPSRADSEGARLFRPGSAPPPRGTLLALADRELALYTKGSIDFYSTYPGMYVPRPLGIRPVRGPVDTAAEILALTKMKGPILPPGHPGGSTVRLARNGLSGL